MTHRDIKVDFPKKPHSYQYQNTHNKDVRYLMCKAKAAALNGRYSDEHLSMIGNIS